MAVSLVAAGCASAAPSRPATAGPPSAKFIATLTGRGEPGGGAPHGTGIAVIALHDGAHEICWRFAHLHGFTAATRAQIRRVAGRGSGAVVLGLASPRSPWLHHRGCVRAPASLMTAIMRQPRRFYVEVEAARFPAGAVRGRL